MKHYDSHAQKKPTNLTINSDLLTKAREQNINLSATLEKALTEELKRKHREQWINENSTAIRAYNEFIEEQGVFSDNVRNF